MKKRIISLLLVLSMSVGLAACGGTTEEATEETTKEAKTQEAELEVDTITFGVPAEGNAHLIIAERLGYFEGTGLKIETVPVEVAEAPTALLTGQVDILANNGSNQPLSLIAAGEEITIFGGALAAGGICIIAKEGTEWNGVEDFVGKKVATEPHTFSITGPLLDMGYDPLKDVEWVDMPNHPDRLPAVVNGEVDYAVVKAPLRHSVLNTPGIEVVAYMNDCMPNFGCCRMWTRTDFFEANPVALKELVKVLIRSQLYIDDNREEVAGWLVEVTGSTEEYVADYFLNKYDNGEYVHQYSIDPLKDAMVKAWQVLNDTGFLSENAKNINIEEHIDVNVYKAALDELIADEEIYSENAEALDKMLVYFEEHNM